MVCLSVRQFSTANIDFSSRIYHNRFNEYTFYLFILDLQDIQNCSLNSSDLGLYSGHHPILYLVVQIPNFVVPIELITELYINCPVSLLFMMGLLRLLPSLMDVQLANACFGLTGTDSGFSYWGSLVYMYCIV